MSTSGADTAIACLRPVIDGLQATFGPWCEVILHDYRDGTESVVAVAGNVTPRTSSGTMSEIGLRVLVQGDDFENDVNHTTRSGDGRYLKCSTMPLRDEEGHVFGALTINLDVTAFRQAESLLATLSGNSLAGEPRSPGGDDFDEVLESVIQTEERKFGKSADALTRMKRVELLTKLDAQGVFAIRGASHQVAQRLGISRSAFYADLAEARRREEKRSRQMALGR